MHIEKLTSKKKKKIKHLSIIFDDDHDKKIKEVEEIEKVENIEEEILLHDIQEIVNERNFSTESDVTAQP